MESANHLVMVFNVPSTFHVEDLRSFFSTAIESEQFFKCFHFRHRPQNEFVSELKICYPPQSNNSNHGESKIFSLALVEDAACAVVECLAAESKALFWKRYHFENWVTKSGTILPARCILADIKTTNEDVTFPLDSLQVSNKVLKLQMSLVKLKNMVEFLPPKLVMPKGNVGTSTQHFKQLIKKCQLPSKLIKKLGLTFPKQRSRKYGCVPYEYEPGCSKVNDDNPNDFVENKKQAYIAASPNRHKENDSSGEEEEWDRHENLHDDVDEQSRVKERLYEEEMEVVWEKGGPGIVWYTDAQYWKQQEGDFDEETSDDWDVDYSVYFEKNSGDMDARDALEMRRSDQWRQTGCESVFKKPDIPNQHRTVKRRCNIKTSRLGSFEMHTRGIGRRLLEKQGWKDGMGLGRTTAGIAEALEPDGQKPRERKGLGYYGEALASGRSATKSAKTGIHISTIYDDILKNDPPEALLTRLPSTQMKYRGDK